MKRFLALAFIFAALLSCQDDITRIRKSEIIPRDKFVEILIGIHLTDVITTGSSYYRMYEPVDTVDLYSELFKKYNITKAEFDTTVAMYIRQPDVYLKIYDEVLLKLNYMLDTLKNNEPLFSKEIEK
jgi:hypothetical protein